MKAIIHIGLPKVGSSSIQEFLKINGDALRTRGIRYAPFNPNFGSQYEFAATGRLEAGDQIGDNVGREALNTHSPESQRAYVDQYRDFLDAGLQTWPEPLFIGSSEHIQPWLSKPEHIAALDDFLRQRFDTVRYVVYLRTQPDLLLSSYSERIRRGQTLSFETHLKGRTKALNFFYTVNKWEKAVGAANLDVRLMTPDALVGGDLLRDFCDVLGTPLDGLTIPPRMNSALSAEEVTLRRRLNAWMKPRRRNGHQNPLYALALRVTGRRLPHPGTPLRLTEEQRATAETTLAPSNERLRKHRFPDRNTLF